MAFKVETEQQCLNEIKYGTANLANLDNLAYLANLANLTYLATSRHARKLKFGTDTH